MSRLAIKTTLAVLFLLANQDLGIGAPCEMEGGDCNYPTEYGDNVDCCRLDILKCDRDNRGTCVRKIPRTPTSTASGRATLPDESMIVTTDEAGKLLGMPVWAGVLLVILAGIGCCTLVALLVAAVWYCAVKPSGGGRGPSRATSKGSCGGRRRRSSRA